MKSDRELLELAAKAAGISKQWDGSLVDKLNPGKVWSPLTDDGDAFRLLATLGLGIVFGQYAPCDIYSVYINEPEGGDTLSVGVIGDNESSGVVRRAIVRAAAVIGKKMP